MDIKTLLEITFPWNMQTKILVNIYLLNFLIASDSKYIILNKI